MTYHMGFRVLADKYPEWENFMTFGLVPLLSYLYSVSIYWYCYSVYGSAIGEQGFLENHNGASVFFMFGTPFVALIIMNFGATIVFYFYAMIIGACLFVIANLFPGGIFINGIIISGFWLVLILVLLVKFYRLSVHDQKLKQYGCPACLDAKAPIYPVNSDCYMCWGKLIIETHPNYEAMELWKKYKADLAITEQERSKLQLDLDELYEQQKLGIETLGVELYAQAVKVSEQYHNQIRLRKTQIAFFEKGLRKVDNLLKGSVVAKNLLQKKKALQHLQEDNVADLGTIMIRKEQFAMHYDLIERVNALTIEIGEQHNTSITADLQTEIEVLSNQL